MHRRFIVIDIIAALIVVGGIVAVGIVVFGRSSGPKPTPFPTQALTLCRLVDRDEYSPVAA